MHPHFYVKIKAKHPQKTTDPSNGQNPRKKNCGEQNDKFFDSNHLHSSKQFGFISKRSASDLPIQLVTSWNKFLDAGKETYLTALDTAGAFDRVWHKGIISKLKSSDIDGDLLKLTEDYLRGRTISSCGYTSGYHPVSASVSHGSVTGRHFLSI